MPKPDREDPHEASHSTPEEAPERPKSANSKFRKRRCAFSASTRLRPPRRGSRPQRPPRPGHGALHW
eukprot:3620648-Pyramimonas_sp.AAC.1